MPSINYIQKKFGARLVAAADEYNYYVRVCRLFLLVVISHYWYRDVYSRSCNVVSDLHAV